MMIFDFENKVLSLFDPNEEVCIKELSEKSKELNNDIRFKTNAINKVLYNELKEKVESCGKNKWKLK